MSSGTKRSTIGGPRARRPLHEWLGDVDRRIIFLVVGAAVALPLIFPLNLPVKTSREHPETLSRWRT